MQALKRSLAGALPLYDTLGIPRETQVDEADAEYGTTSIRSSGCVALSYHLRHLVVL